MSPEGKLLTVQFSPEVRVPAEMNEGDASEVLRSDFAPIKDPWGPIG